MLLSQNIYVFSNAKTLLTFVPHIKSVIALSEGQPFPLHSLNAAAKAADFTRACTAYAREIIQIISAACGRANGYIPRFNNVRMMCFARLHASKYNRYIFCFYAPKAANVTSVTVWNMVHIFYFVLILIAFQPADKGLPFQRRKSISTAPLNIFAI